MVLGIFVTIIKLDPVHAIFPLLPDMYINLFWLNFVTTLIYKPTTQIYQFVNVVYLSFVMLDLGLQQLSQKEDSVSLSVEIQYFTGHFIFSWKCFGQSYVQLI